MQAYYSSGYSRFFRWICPKSGPEKCREFLKREGFIFNRVPEVPGAWVETGAPGGLGASLAWYFGFIYIQDLSSMLPAILLDPAPGNVVLDMCAAPGGKSAQLSEMVGDDGLVIANDPSRDRLGILRANLERLNVSNVVSTCYAGQEMPQGIQFDCILVDAPCSGWGTVKKNPAVTRIWKKENINPLVVLQRRLLYKAALMLAPGGRLVYSTCTTNAQENQEQVRWILSRSSLKPSSRTGDLLMQSGLPGLDSPGAGMLCMEGKQAGAQSFFMAALEKPLETAGVQESIGLKPPVTWERVEPGDLVKNMPLNTWLYAFSDKVFLVPDAALPYVERGLRVKGIFAGRIKKPGFVPGPRLRVFLEEKNSHGYQAREIQEVHALVSGQSLEYCLQPEYKMLPFYWQGLPLGWLHHRKSRIFWSDK